MKKLRAWMDVYNVSQSELARRMSVSQPTVWAWINGESMPSIENIRRLSELTGISASDLIACEQAA